MKKPNVKEASEDYGELSIQFLLSSAVSSLCITEQVNLLIDSRMRTTPTILPCASRPWPSKFLELV